MTRRNKPFGALVNKLVAGRTQCLDLQCCSAAPPWRWTNREARHVARGRMSVFTDEMPATSAHFRAAGERGGSARRGAPSSRERKGGRRRALSPSSPPPKPRGGKRRELAQVGEGSLWRPAQPALLQGGGEAAGARTDERDRCCVWRPCRQFARKKAGSSKASSPAAAPAPSGPVAPAAAPSSALLDDSSAIWGRRSPNMGNNHPGRSRARAPAVEGRLVSVEPELLEAEVERP